MYIDKPAIMITNTIVGCGYVNILWSTTITNDECMIFYNVTLSYDTMDNHVTVTMVTQMNSYTFTELPDDTQVNITVTGISLLQAILSFDTTSVTTTNVYESMCKLTNC